MNTVQKYIGVVVLFVILILGVGIYMIKINHIVPEAPVVAQLPVVTPRPTENDRIIEAMKLFASSSPELFKDNYVCKGGFINVEIDELKRISDTIVRNRIVDPQTMQYAINQDEAGIICAETGDAWALFTALNDTNRRVGADAYCVDSLGTRGIYMINVEKAVCEDMDM